MPNLEPTEKLSVQYCPEHSYCSTAQKATAKYGAFELDAQVDFTKNNLTFLRLLCVFDTNNTSTKKSAGKTPLRQQQKTAVIDRVPPNTLTYRNEISPIFRGPKKLLGRKSPLSRPDIMPHSHLLFR